MERRRSPGLGVFSGEGGSKRITTYPVQVRHTLAWMFGHASPVKWCLKEKVLLGKWSAIAMLELQHIQFAGWALTEGQHRGV